VGWLRDTLGRFGGGAPAPGSAPPVAVSDWRKLGNDALAAGDLGEAARCYEQGVSQQPADAALRLNLGFVLLEQGRFAPAAERLEQALALRRPGDGCAPHEAHYLLGRAHAGLGEQEKAFASFEAAARAQPDFVEALEEAARTLHQLERHEESVQWVERLLRLQPTVFNSVLLATELSKCGRHEEAAALLSQVCAEHPDHVEASVLRYRELLQLGRHAEALAEVDRLLALALPSASLLVNRGVALERLGRQEEALASIDAALALEPARRDALVNRATLLLAQVRVHEAVRAAEEALKLYPEDGDLHWTLGMGLLLLGDLRRGWAEGEWRTRSIAFRGKLLQLEQPRWQGESLEGRTIFLHAEQGFGDNIQFLRFVPEVARQARSVLLLVSPELEPLVSGTLPANCRILPQNSMLPAIDFHCPLMSVPAVLGTTLETIPAEVPYLHAQPAAVAAWRDRLGAGAGPKVGVAWSGNARHGNDHNRSMSLATFRAAAPPGSRFFTVQPQTRESDQGALAAWTQAVDAGKDLRDFADTAALMEALDLVITVDTSVAHLAGALGRPVWILLPYSPDWRWMLERTDSPWYPTARLYRQPAAGDWASVLARVKEDLSALAQVR
jgi:tetratricopeptide (TPR) repeat protein